MKSSKERAHAAVGELKDAILDYLATHPDGVSHIQLVDDLELRSDYEGGSKNYLSWSILGLLIADGKVRYTGDGRTKRYFAK
jgi:hypothetical protein